VNFCFYFPISALNLRLLSHLDELLFPASTHSLTIDLPGAPGPLDDCTIDGHLTFSASVFTLEKKFYSPNLLLRLARLTTVLVFRAKTRPPIVPCRLVPPMRGPATNGRRRRTPLLGQWMQWLLPATFVYLNILFLLTSKILWLPPFLRRRRYLAVCPELPPRWHVHDEIMIPVSS
jgi:hypothetical protein